MKQIKFFFRLLGQRVLCLRLGATVLASCGVLLLFLGFWIDPRGVIDTSVLIAFGELILAMYSLLGIRRAEGGKSLPQL